MFLFSIVLRIRDILLTVANKVTEILMEKGLNRFIDKYIFDMSKREIIPNWMVILTGGFAGLIVGIVISIIIFPDLIKPNTFIFYWIIVLIIGGLIGFGLAFSSKNGN